MVLRFESHLLEWAQRSRRLLQLGATRIARASLSDLSWVIALVSGDGLVWRGCLGSCCRRRGLGANSVIAEPRRAGRLEAGTR